MRMALGDFRFLVPTFSIDTLRHSVEGRVANQDVIGSAPITHLLGPGLDTLDFESTFFPLHMNRGGLELLGGLQAAVRAQTIMPLMGVQGLVGLPMGQWLLTSASGDREQAAAFGPFQVVRASLSLQRYSRQGGNSRTVGVL